jgi:hypothetical protein
MLRQNASGQKGASPGVRIYNYFGNRDVWLHYVALFLGAACQEKCGFDPFWPAMRVRLIRAISPGKASGRPSQRVPRWGPQEGRPRRARSSPPVECR